MLEWIALIALLLFCTTGIVLCLAGIGGTFLILAGALIYNLLLWNMSVPVETLAILFALAFLGEILEWILTIFGIRAHGVSRYGLIGTIAGAVIGGMLLSVFPVVGTIIGIFIGALTGAFLLELYNARDTKRALKAAKAAVLGRMLTSVCKTTIALVQILIIVKTI